MNVVGKCLLPLLRYVNNLGRRRRLRKNTLERYCQPDGFNARPSALLRPTVLGRYRVFDKGNNNKRAI